MHYLLRYGTFQGFYYSSALNHAGGKIGMADDNRSHKTNNLLKLKSPSS